ncbi:MAG: amidohydrolase family protein [Caulobacteraceae bacterium]
MARPADAELQGRRQHRSRLSRHLRRRDHRVDREEPIAPDQGAPRGSDGLLAARLDHGPPRWRRGRQHGLDRRCNDLIRAGGGLFPESFIGVCQLPQSPGQPISHSVAELERCVNDLGFIGCNLNPDPSGGHWTAPP